MQYVIETLVVRLCSLLNLSQMMEAKETSGCFAGLSSSTENHSDFHRGKGLGDSCGEWLEGKVNFGK